MTPYKMTAHAKEEMARRQINPTWVDSVMTSPQQIIPSRAGRNIYQSQFTEPNGKLFLLRVIVDTSATLMTIVTMYKTSKVEKYWSVQ